ncbi:hypothetical protein H0H93_011221, partial [Arthromyces matolae]
MNISVPALNNGVGRLPFMGYNTWNAYAVSKPESLESVSDTDGPFWCQCNIDEGTVLQTATLMKSLGLRDVGYHHVNLDDCWSEKNRSASGDLVANKERFPSGMNNLTNQIHALGLKAGIYGDSGWFTCQLYPGSFQNEERDVTQFQKWGFDLLKYDNCAVPFDDIIKQGIYGKYQRMSSAIAELSVKSQKPPILFSLCPQWNVLASIIN